MKKGECAGMRINHVIMLAVVLVIVMATSGCKLQQNSLANNESILSPSVSPSSQPHVDEVAPTVIPTVDLGETAVNSAVNLDDGFRGIRQIDKTGMTVHEWALDSSTILQPILIGEVGSVEEALLAYSPSNRQVIVQPIDGSHISLAEPKWSDEEKSYGNDYGSDVLYADRLLNNMMFAVKGNRTLYLVNVMSGHTKKLYSATNPVYGIAASPDNSKVALLIASGNSLSTYADLIVLNAKGKTIYSKKKAAYLSHSDGFLFVYPMAWSDSHTLAVPFGGHGEYSQWSRAYIDIAVDKTVIREQEELPEKARDLLVQYAGEVDFLSLLRILPESAANPSRYYAVELENGESWLLDVDRNQATRLGKGKLLKWTREGEVLMWKPNIEEPFYYIGLDNSNRIL
jgi:hypothetical protein